MKIAFLKKAFMTALILFAVGNVDSALAHSGGGVLDPGGNNASATDLAAITCFDDGNGTPHHLSAQIKDMSGPVSGLLLSLHIYKGIQMTTSTDTVSGDVGYSPEISLNGGAGVYYLSATKTGAGARLFDVVWHCLTSSGVHTGTDIVVYQAQ
ncbi:hypothetical protein [Candidatus Methylobacter oryzae]|uniref:Uncharacterized protein n=1 Tax=Candidatus Methylobacter oryzae TaxID=2497749 RepID=A0ABY3CBK8_9GAMM|nr:hypothetical protein [Candidatus Methylobacter oryzae]TRW92800.1 hypothetical protein EKO24_014460 [Candidatus Methylobacter oryzae]